MQKIFSLICAAVCICLIGCGPCDDPDCTICDHQTDSCSVEELSEPVGQLGDRVAAPGYGVFHGVIVSRELDGGTWWYEVEFYSVDEPASGFHYEPLGNNLYLSSFRESKILIYSDTISDSHVRRPTYAVGEETEEPIEVIEEDDCCDDCRRRMAIEAVEQEANERIAEAQAYKDFLESLMEDRTTLGFRP